VGNFTADIPVSSLATTSTITITVRDASGISATATLQINAPTPTATPTATPSPTPTATVIPISDLMPSFAHAALKNKSVKENGYDTITIQGAPATKLKVRLQVLFPAGQHLKLTSSTGVDGGWSHLFHVPNGAISTYSHTAFVLIQLWNGTHSRKDFLPLTLTK